MATPVLSNGVFLRDTIFKPQAHIDSYHLMNMFNDAKATDLGIFEYWAQTQQAQAPLYTFSAFGGKNVIQVNNLQGKYTWQTAIVNDMPHITRDLDPSNATKGIYGQTFTLALNRRAFGHTDIITYDKYGGLEMYVVDEPIIGSEFSDEYIYTVRLVNNDSTAYLDNMYLVPQTSFFRVSSARGEYGERWSDVNTMAGMREFYNFVGNAQADASYSVSQRAHAIMMNTKGGTDMREIWQFTPNDPNDPSRVNIPMAAERAKQIGLLKMLKEGSVTMSYVTALEAASISKVMKDVEEYLMWGKGGHITQDGPDDIRLTTGLWKQMDNSFKRVYNIGTFDLNSVLESELYNFYNGRVDFKGPDPHRKIVITTGIAGMRQANETIKKFVINSGLVTNASEVGAVTGSGMDLDYGYAYTSYTIPFLANVKFVINPALDPVLSNDIENPVINGYRLSSYCYIIWDVTDNGGNDNIFMLKHISDTGLNWFHQNGTCDYKGSTQGFASVGDFNGYRCKMFMNHKAIQVKDPTKILKIVPFNPITGKGFGS